MAFPGSVLIRIFVHSPFSRYFSQQLVAAGQKMPGQLGQRIQQTAPEIQQCIQNYMQVRWQTVPVIVSYSNRPPTLTCAHPHWTPLPACLLVASISIVAFPRFLCLVAYEQMLLLCLSIQNLLVHL